MYGHVTALTGLLWLLLHTGFGISTKLWDYPFSTLLHLEGSTTRKTL